MVQRPSSLLLALLLVVGSGFGQDRSNPVGISRTSTRNPASTVVGILRKIADEDMVVEADDKRIVTVALGITTKFLKPSGNLIRSSELQPGDHISLDVTQDDKGVFHAKNVTQVKVGTPQERAAASRPVETSTSADTPKTAARDLPVPPDPNVPGPPKLKRGIPQRNSSDPPLVAENDPSPSSRPSIHAAEVNGVTRAPEAPKVGAGGVGGAQQRRFGGSGDPVIDDAREAAFSFSQTLPNYVVKQFTTRYETEAARGGQTSWHAIDTVTADVVSEKGKETYKNILVNGRAPKEAIEKTGTWSTGEYSSVLLDVLSPGTQADFHNKRSTTIVNRSAWRYDFSVDRENSHWHVSSSSESYVPEYTGAIWIDKESTRVLRIELVARNMPKAFALDTVESSVDYDNVPIGDGKYLLPVHSEALSCDRGTSECSRNVIDFRNYKKFSADTNITFDPPERN